MLKAIKGKSLIFLEKDYECPSSKDCIDSAKSFLDCWMDIPLNMIDAMKIHYQFQMMEREELYKLIFNPNHVIVSYSVYVQGSQNSLQFFLNAASRNSVSGITYIDTSGCIIDYLNRNLKEIDKNVFGIISGINSNNIISIEYDEDKPTPKLVKIDIGKYWDDCVKLIPLVPKNIIAYDDK